MKGIWKYSALLPFVGDEFRMTLGEGNTPLIRSKHIGKELGLENLYFKLEMTNPSGSYKDRFAASAVSNILAQGGRMCLATSSGNTGAALAAYSAMAGIKCFLTVVDGAPAGKLQQMRVYGSEVLMVRDFGKDAAVTEQIMDVLSSLAQSQGTAVQISAFCYSPLGMAGVQTIAYEIAESLGSEADHVFTPAGGGGLMLALMKGFKEWMVSNPDYRPPIVNCVQPSGNNTIAGAIREGAEATASVGRSETTISGLQVPNVLDGDEILRMGNKIVTGAYLVNDSSVYDCQRELAVKEGIFCEPASAVSLAGLKTALAEGTIKSNDTIVCLITGHGFKDPNSAEQIASHSASEYFGETDALSDYIQAQVQTIK